MKQILIALSLLLFTARASHADEKYQQLMKENIAALIETMDGEELKKIQNTFERIGKKETTEWLPNYYAAYALVKQTWTLKQGDDQIDMLMDRAQDLIGSAEATTEQPVADLLLMKTMINSARIMVNPMTRGRELGGKNQELLKQAYALEQNNPRYYLLVGQALYYTPDLFGGDKKKAKEMFQKTIEITKEYQPKSEIHPNWGKETAEYFLAQYKN